MERGTDRSGEGGRSSCGPMLGYKIVTVQAESDDEDRVTVVVAVREAPEAEEGERMRERSLLLMNELWSKSWSAVPHGTVCGGSAETGRVR
jgi:hypothetical protein